MTLPEQLQPDDASAGVASFGPSRFFNRELSWLHFNRRVLEEAENERHPLLERLRFLSISASNLDEFYMVRVAGLRGQVVAGIDTPSQDGLTPAEQLDRINRFVAELTDEQQESWVKLEALLAEAGIYVLQADQLTDTERTWLEDHFLSHIFPVLTPIAVDPAHPFPFIPNFGFTLGLELVREGSLRTMPGLGGAESGDALVEILVKPHPVFRREGDDIVVEVPISFDEAVLGGKVEVPTITGNVFATVPPGTNTGKTLRLKGRGIKRKNGKLGDELVKLTVVMPDRIDEDLKAFAEEWRGKHRYDPRRKHREQA